MLDIVFTRKRDGQKFKVLNVRPNGISRDRIRALLAFGLCCELEAIGIYEYEYEIFETGIFPIIPTPGDLLHAINLAFGGTRRDAKLWMSMITGESEDMVECWLLGQYKIPKNCRKDIVRAIIEKRAGR